MHSIAEIGTNVPAFLGKLWKMVEDPETNDFITWSSSGTSFVIKDEIRFARELLPMYYKHNNMASFIRQLNMYGFHKIVSPEAGSMKLESDEIQFSHPFFVRGHAYLLDSIKRKIGVSKVHPEQLQGKPPQGLTKVLTDMRQMMGRQESMENRLTAMKLENGALWRELSVQRQKHIKQQQIVNKLIQFLVTIVQQNHNSFSVKRKFPRMLQHHSKPNSKHLHPDDADDRASDQSHSPSGPIIHELDPAEALLETVVTETGPISPSDVTNYFLDQTIEDGSEEVVADVDLTGSLQETPLENINTETIIGIPEDTLVTNRIKKPQVSSPSTNRSGSQTSPSVSAQKKINNVTEVKPTIVRIFQKLPKEAEAQLHVRQPQKQQPEQQPIQRQIKNNLQKQIKVHQQQIEVNKEQMQNQKKLQKNNQQLKRSRQQQQQQQIQNNQPQIQRTQQQIQRTQQQIRRNHLQQIQRQQEFKRKKQQQLQNNQLQELLVLKKEPQLQTDTVITVSLNNGEAAGAVGDTGCTNLKDVEPLYVEPTSDDYDVPILVEVPAVDTEPVPTHTYTSDLLLSSPLVLADPMMTPSSDPPTTPIVSSPSSAGSTSRSNMQVACVDDTQANSSNIVTRSALL